MDLTHNFFRRVAIQSAIYRKKFKHRKSRKQRTFSRKIKFRARISVFVLFSHFKTLCAHGKLDQRHFTQVECKFVLFFAFFATLWLRCYFKILRQRRANQGKVKQDKAVRKWH